MVRAPSPYWRVGRDTPHGPHGTHGARRWLLADQDHETWPGYGLWCADNPARNKGSWAASDGYTNAFAHHQGHKVPLLHGDEQWRGRDIRSDAGCPGRPT